MTATENDSPFDLRLTRNQRRRLSQLLPDAGTHVPFYRQRYSAAKLTLDDLSSPSVVERLPIITKGDLVSAPLDERRNRRFDAGQLRLESTTGSTGQPVEFCLDRSYIRRRNLRFLRALIAIGWRPWKRLMLLTDRYTALNQRWPNCYYVPVEQNTDALLAAFSRIRPQVLYGFMTPLRLLADAVHRSGQKIPRPDCVVSTAEVLGPDSRQRLEAVFDCPVCDFYGSTEMGLVAWQRPGESAYFVVSDSILVEYRPVGDARGPFRLIMTNLELQACPVLRFECGDLAHVANVNGSPVLQRLEGRQIDTLVSATGEELSPYRITDALRHISGLRRFQITQHDIASIEVRLEVAPLDTDIVRRQVSDILYRLLGDGLDLDVECQDRLVPDGAVKFRPIECRLQRS